MATKENRKYSELFGTIWKVSETFGKDCFKAEVFEDDTENIYGTL